MWCYNVLSHDQISVKNEIQTLYGGKGIFRILVAMKYTMCLDNKTR